jgi:two-component system chemotaxis response regulator CheB
MRTIRVVVVDGDPGSRGRLRRALEGDSGVEVVGASGLGALALDKVGRLNPDLVCLGVGPGESEAWTTLAILRADCPELPIVVVGTDARKGSPTALDALSRGASGCVAFGDDGSPEGLRAEVRSRAASVARPMPVPSGTGHAPTLATSGGRVEVVVIGSSAGGPNGLVEVVKALPPDLPVPVLIAQHNTHGFNGPLSERLHALGSIPVREAVDGEPIHSGMAWLGPTGVHLGIARERGSLRIRLIPTRAEDRWVPSVDELFRSAVGLFGGAVLGVVLTGMGNDGLRGCRAIREAGGTVLVQDEATSTVWGMPGCVAEAGLAHEVLPISRIGAAIARLAKAGQPVRPGG